MPVVWRTDESPAMAGHDFQDEQALAHDWDARADAVAPGNAGGRVDAEARPSAGKFESQAMTAGSGPVIRWMARVSDQHGTAGTIAIVLVLSVPALGLAAAVSAAFGATGFWLVMEGVCIAGLAWAYPRLRTARAASASPQVIARYGRMASGFAFLAVLTAVRLATHSYH